MKIEINPSVIKEFNYIIELQQKHGAITDFDNVEEMINYILFSVADGSRRPGSWERGMLKSMGLVAECDEHQEYRNCYGATDDE